MALDPATPLLTELELQQQGGSVELRSAQRISMSLASRNPTKNLLCQPPTVQSIPYYHTSGAVTLNCCGVALPSSPSQCVDAPATMSNAYCVHS